MRSLSKVLGAIGIIAAVAVAASAADARSRNTAPAYDSVRTHGVSVPYDAGGPAYVGGQHGLDSSSDFQLQGR